jgi:hypothetical protein
MNLPPLPALKPNEEGTGYTYCPACARQWLTLLLCALAIGGAYYYLRTSKGD